MKDRRLFLTTLSSGLAVATAGLATRKVLPGSEIIVVDATKELKTITLTPAQESYLTCLLNMELRGSMTDRYRTLINGIFVQVGRPRHQEPMVRAGLLAEGRLLNEWLK